MITHLFNNTPLRKRFYPSKIVRLLLATSACLFFLAACKPNAPTGKPLDNAEIAREFVKANQGDAKAQFNIGLLFLKGEGFPQDYQKAQVWFEKAARQGLGQAQYNLGVMLEQGLGIKQNAPDAKHWYEKAAEQGIAHAQYSLALLYLSGNGVSQDLGKAKQWMQKAAEQGMSEAKERFSTLTGSPSGSFDHDKITAWLKQSVLAGKEKAQLLREKIRSED